jgi:molybdopterin-containing oxidoreductase family membrane subunit
MAELDHEKTAQNVDKILVSVTRTTGGFYKFLVVSLLILAWFGFAYYQQLSKGLVVTGLNEPIYMGLYIATFIWLVGLAHGGISISAAVTVFKLENYKPVARLGELLTLICLTLSGIMITFDIGRPDRALNLLRFGRWQSPLSWDVFIIVLYFMGSLTFFYIGLRREMPEMIKRFPDTLMTGVYKFLGAGYKGTEKDARVNKKAGYYLGIALLLVMCSASGFVIPLIFALQVAQPGWFTALFPIYFLAAALGSAMAAVIIMAYVSRRMFDWYDFIPDRIIVGLANVLRVFLLVYIYFIVCEHLVIRYAGLGPEQNVSNAMFFGEFAPFWWAYLIFGLIVPFLMLVIPQTRTIKGILIASCLVVPALWLKRMIIVVPPLSRQLFPNPVIDPATRSSFIDPLTTIGVYSPSWVEWSLLVGTLALGVLLFAIFAKFFPLIELDVGEVHIEPEPIAATPAAAGEAATAPQAAGPPAQCELCDATFSNIDECCEHAEREHGIAKDSCDMACAEMEGEAEAAPAAEAKMVSKCGLCDAEFASKDECCEHAEKEHAIAKDSCDMACEDM